MAAFARVTLRATAALVAGLAAVLAGCGRPVPASLEGTVTFRGRPVQAGAIRLFPGGATPGHGAGAAVTDGRYRIEAGRGLVAGTYRIEMVGFEGTGKTVPAEDLQPGQPETVPETVQILPPRYNEESQLVVTVKAGENTHDLALE